MFNFNSRGKLEREGLSSGQRRRKVNETGFRAALESGIPAKVALFVLFGVITTLFLIVARSQPAPEGLTIGGALFHDNLPLTIVMVTGLVLAMVVHFRVNHPQSFPRNGRVLLTLGAILFHLVALKGIYVTVQNEVIAPDYFYLLPAYSLAPMTLSILLGQRHGTFATIFTALFGALLGPSETVFQFILLSLVAGFTAVFLTKKLSRRSRVVTAGFMVGAVTMLFAVATGLIRLNTADWTGMSLQCLAPLAAGIVTAMIVGTLLPFLENWFGITTELSWLEMADLNHPLLREMSTQAPGTHHHSQMVAQLSEAAAEAIGANASMCRVASYFHDIGKLKKPQYFIENNSESESPHGELTPTMSALIIIAHVKDGVDMALKHGLNSEIIDVIREHHGTTLVEYFYGEALAQRRKVEELVNEGKANPEDLPAVQKKEFRYPGPRAQSRESAIISLADAAESSIRSIKKLTPNRIEQKITEIVEKRLKEGQLDMCPLTLSDINKIRKSFYSSLCAMNHNRIAYPEDESKKKKASQKEEREKGKEAAAAARSTNESSTTKETTSGGSSPSSSSTSKSPRASSTEKTHAR